MWPAWRLELRARTALAVGTSALHTGIGEAGSSNIQSWRATRSTQLREGDIDVLVARLRHVDGRAIAGALPRAARRLRSVIDLHEHGTWGE